MLYMFQSKNSLTYHTTNRKINYSKVNINEIFQYKIYLEIETDIIQSIFYY